ncbi:hypothetical protein LCGC14_1481240 [marine sediment metagenome]|uniref:Leucine-rich repeat domain-containing protein n=1 Tax=marine sediment metagenome TaxID=412755 RepID=A0A0F9LQ10_9ZZZZ
MKYSRREIHWIYGDYQGNKYVVINSPREAPDSLIGVEMEKNDIVLGGIRDSMECDAGVSLSEKKGFVLSIPELGIIDISKIEGLEKLTELRSLDLAGNEFLEIKGLEKLVNLEYLDLGYNKISEITGLENLTNLKGLLLAGNKIKEIKGLENLVNLFYLDLSENSISEIKGLENLVNLKQVFFNKIKIKEKILNKILEETVPKEVIREIKKKSLLYRIYKKYKKKNINQIDEEKALEVIKYDYYTVPNFAQEFVEYCQRKKVMLDREDKEKRANN